ncbi:GIY-YIG nuclease family protein [Campylobacter upsaliensis]|uniref:GIY-YIG nuclease family protein n=1 Tax=Campylobacter upsaliensis TaxID=28080 RepID=UPI0022EA1217|nr:GIY-YIG nuclease family protein [Campylobacter upsaliensis]
MKYLSLQEVQIMHDMLKGNKMESTPTCYNITSPCHTERSEVSHNAVSTKESRFFANAQNDNKKESQNDRKDTNQNNLQITLTQNQLSLAKYPAYIYMMSNATNSTLYIGVTSNLAKRIYEHKHKLMQGFSQIYNCTRLVYFEAFENISQAIEREKYLKGKKRDFKNKLIESINPQYKDLSEFLGLDTAFTAKGDTI